MFKKPVFLFLLIFVSGSIAAQKNNKTEQLISFTDSIIQKYIAADLIPGAVVGIKKDGKLIMKKAYGYANKYDYDHRLANQPEMTDPDYLYDLASLTKVVGTTTSIMLLADAGRLHIDDPVGKFIPAFNKGEKKSITIRHLLTHSSGITEWYPLFYRANNKEETFRLIGDLPLKYPVGQGRHYSDLGFTILGQIIEVISGLPLDTFMYKNIFVPLKMNHTTFNPLKEGKFKKIASTSHGNPYEYRMTHDSTLGFLVEGIDPDSWNGWRKYTLHGEVNDGNAWYAEQGVCGAAGLFSNVDDLQILVDMLLNKGKAGNRSFISEKTLRTFLTRDHFKNGLGWVMDTDDSIIKNGPEGSFGHTGFTGTSLAVVPEYNASLIILINRQNVGLQSSQTYFNVNPIRREIFTALMKYCKEK